MQRVAKRARFVAREHLRGQRELLGHPQHKRSGREPLWWLRRAAVEDSLDHIAVQMHVDSQFERLGLGCRRVAGRLRFGWGFVALGFVVIQRGSGVLGFPAPDHPMLSFWVTPLSVRHREAAPAPNQFRRHGQCIGWLRTVSFMARTNGLSTSAGFRESAITPAHWIEFSPHRTHLHGTCFALLGRLRFSEVLPRDLCLNSIP